MSFNNLSPVFSQEAVPISLPSELCSSSQSSSNPENPIIISDNPMVPSSFGQKILKQRKPRARPIDWSPEMTTVLLRELIQAIRCGKRSDNGFKMEVWNEIADTVRTVSGYGVLLTGDKCQGKLESLKRKWKIWTRLKGMSGFGFDPIMGTVTAPDDVWDAEIQRQPAIREFRDKPMGNVAELEEILEGMQATGRGAIYPRAGFSQQQPIDIESTIHEDDQVDSDHTEAAENTNAVKRWKIDDINPLMPLGRIRQRIDTPSARLVNVVEKMIATPIALPTSTSIIGQAVTKLRENYKGKAGWPTADILAGYAIFENSVKAEIFVALDGGEDEEMWLRGQIESRQA